MHTDQRLRVESKRHRGVLQPSWWQGANLRRYEQWLWMEPVAEIIHVTEYGFLAHDCPRQKLLQSHHAEIGDPKVWIASH